MAPGSPVREPAFGVEVVLLNLATALPNSQVLLRSVADFNA